MYVILRDYQSRDLDRIRNEFMRGCRCVVYMAPTGAGKTVLFVELVCRIRATATSVSSSSSTGKN
jgi:superfamily II DNA or RNA helicase